MTTGQRSKRDEYAGPPHDEDAEIQVVACALQDARGHEAADLALQILRPSHFYSPRHQVIWDAIDGRRREGEPIELSALRGHLAANGMLEAAGGCDYLHELRDSTATIANVEHYARIVRDHAKRRGLIQFAAMLSEEANGQRSNVGSMCDRFAEHIRSLEIDPRDSGAYEPDLVCLADIAEERPHYLWEPRIPSGTLTILGGDPKAGKSTVALTIAAIVSRGWAWPDNNGKPTGPCGDPAPVIYLTQEDSLPCTIRPRLRVAGADVNLIHAIKGKRRKKDRTGTTIPISLRDLDVLEIATLKIHPALIIIDTLTGYLGVGTNSNAVHEVKPLLAALVAFAERHHVAILAIDHLNKSTNTKAIYRLLASIGFAGAARSILLAGPDPLDANKRALVHAATNFRQAGPIGYRLVDVDGHARLEWSCSDATPESVTAQPDEEGGGEALSEAIDVLRQILSAGPVEAKAVLTEAHAAGISDRTLSRAKAKLHVHVVKQPGIHHGPWLWRLNGNTGGDHVTPP